MTASPSGSGCSGRSRRVAPALTRSCDMPNMIGNFDFAGEGVDHIAGAVMIDFIARVHSELHLVRLLQ